MRGSRVSQWGHVAIRLAPRESGKHSLVGVPVLRSDPMCGGCAQGDLAPIEVCCSAAPISKPSDIKL